MNRLSAAVVEPLAAAWRRPAGLQHVCRAAGPAACDWQPFSVLRDDLTSGKGIGASDARGPVLSAGYAVRLRGNVTREREDSPRPMNENGVQAMTIRNAFLIFVTKRGRG